MINFLRQLLATPQPTAPSKADKNLTPGVTNPLVTQANIHQTIGKPGWAAKQRPPSLYTNKIKQRQMKDQGLPGNTSDYEEDHLIPLELGGNPDSRLNLWPQRRKPAPGAVEKDKQENYLRAAVLDGRMTLAYAQAVIVKEWSE